MSVLEQLGVLDLQQALVEAGHLWPDWIEQDFRLAQAPPLSDLQDWLLGSDRTVADEVLHGLVRIGSPSGGDCLPASWVVIWALLPGASAASRRVRGGRETDALIASQLWLEVRQFAWWRHSKVAGNVMANVRSALARDGALKRPSWAERHTAPTDWIPERQLEKHLLPEDELAEVFSWGEQNGLIDRGDRLLLTSLVDHTGSLRFRPHCRAGQGLMSAPALTAAGAELGLSSWAVRRRARRSIDALAAASRSRSYES